MTNRFKDPLWRLTSEIYRVKDKATGRVMKFRPHPEQRRIFDLVYREGRRRIVIPKARQLGMSTAIDIMGLDCVLWNPGFQFSIVDQTQADASRKLRDTCKVAFEGMPEGMRGEYDIKVDSGSMFRVQAFSKEQAGISAGMHARGGTNHGLHISEWGPIQYEDAKRSEEIMTGALPSVPDSGWVVVETTWKGRKGGHLGNIVDSAINTPEEHKTPEDWHLEFFPWWKSKEYTTKGNPAQITPEYQEYFEHIEQLERYKFSPGQKLWYFKKRETLGLYIYSEFPSTLEECWKAPVEGAIYQRLVEQAKTEKRVGDLAYDASLPVFTFWDLGAPKNTVVWFVQLVGNRVHVLECDGGEEETSNERVARMLAKGYSYGGHYLPHDGGSDLKIGWSMKAELERNGLRPVYVVPKPQDVPISGINRLQQRFGQLWFREADCEDGLEALSNYHWAKRAKEGSLRDEPEHDWSSHYADALRVFSEADMAGMLEGKSMLALEGRRKRHRERKVEVVAKVRGFR